MKYFTKDFNVWEDFVENETTSFDAYNCENGEERFFKINSSLCKYIKSNYNIALSDNNIWHLPYNTWQTSIIALLIILCVLVTIFGNVLVLLAFLLERSIRQPSNYFICSLAVSDLAIGMISMPIFAKYILQGRWELGSLICNIWLATDHSICLVSIYTVLLITIDRYCSIKIAIKYRCWRTRGKVLFMIAAIWIIPCAIFFTTILGWEHFTGTKEFVPGECFVQFLKDPVFNTTLTFIYFYVTLLVLFVLYGGIYSTAKKMQQRSELKQHKLQTLVRNGRSSNTGNISQELAIPNQSLAESKLKPKDISEESSSEKNLCGPENRILIINVNDDKCQEYQEQRNSDSHSSTQESNSSDDDEKGNRENQVFGESTTRNVREPIIKELRESWEIKKCLETDAQFHGKRSCSSCGNSEWLKCYCHAVNFFLGENASDFHEEKITCKKRDSRGYAFVEKGRPLSLTDLPSERPMNICSKSLNFRFSLHNNRGSKYTRMFNPGSLHVGMESPEFSALNMCDEPNRVSTECNELTVLCDETEICCSNSAEDDNDFHNSLHALEDDPSPKGTNSLKCFPLSNKLMTANKSEPLLNASSSESLPFVTPNIAESSTAHQHEAPRHLIAVQNESHLSTLSIEQKCRFMFSLKHKFKSDGRKSSKKYVSRKENRARKALRTISFILGAFVICWTPYHICSLIEGFCGNPEGCVNSHLFYFTYFLCYANSPINPFCYAMANNQFRKAFYRILKGNLRMK